MALTVGMASGVSPAYAASTSSRLKSLEKSVKTLKSQMISVLARITALEARAGVAGPAGPKGDTGPSAAAAFWPASAISLVDPSAVMYASMVVSPAARDIEIDLYPTTKTVGNVAQESFMKITTDKGTFASAGGFWRASHDLVGVSAMPTEGSDITVEYWISRYGVNRHESRTFTGWTYDDVPVGTSGVGIDF
jgi:hypothetical protein